MRPALLFASAIVPLALSQLSYADELVTQSIDLQPEDISNNKTLPTELKNGYNWWQTKVKLNTAYLMGARGAGVNVAVVDTGVDLNNTKFKGRILPGYNAFAPTALAMDDNGHGTHVAGIIGAAADGNLMVGAAPEVKIIPVKVLNAAGSGNEATFNAGMNFASKSSAKILSMSLGASGPFGQAGLQQAVNAGKLVVIAAGNSGLANPAWPARYAKETWAKGQVIAVGAVDSNNTIASFSNRAGDTRNFYVVAPGVNIASTYPGNRFAYMSGTSMAAPVVSGVAADIYSRWMYLTANQVATIIFRTADHLGTSAVGTPDAVYGWGLVNADRALQPVGAPKVAVYNAGYYALAPLALKTNALIQSKAFSGIALTATDDIGRAYDYDFAGVTDQHSQTDLDHLFGKMDRDLALVERKNSQTSLQYSIANDGEKTGVHAFNLIQNLSNQWQIATGNQGLVERFIGASANTENLPFTTQFSNPYFTLSDDRLSYVGLGYQLDNSQALRFALINNFDIAANATQYHAQNQQNGWVAEYQQDIGKMQLKFTVGQLNESGGMLGTYSRNSGVLDFGHSQTLFGGVSSLIALGKNTHLLGQFNLGRSTSDGSGLIGSTQTNTTNWSLGLYQQKVIAEHDSLGFAVSQPMRVSSGKMNLLLPQVDRETGNSSYQNLAIDLASPATETDLELAYSNKISNGARLRFNAVYRHNADNQLGDKTQVGVRYQQSF